MEKYWRERSPEEDPGVADRYGEAAKTIEEIASLKIYDDEKARSI